MKKILALIVSALTAVSVVFGVTTANAYPTGQNFRLNVSSTIVDPNTTVTAYATKAYPGCLVTFTSTSGGKLQQKFTSTANGSGTTGNVNFSISKLGLYTLKATYSCNGFSESSSVNVTSGRQTTTTVFLSSAAGSKTFRVYGSVLWGNSGVPLISGSGLLKDPSGSKQSFTATTDASGNYSVNVTVRKIVPGNYVVNITFANKSPYLGSSASNSLFKSATTTLTGSSVTKGTIK